MTTPPSQFYESYLPVYDAIPEKWEDGRAYMVEAFKNISNAVNIREIGWLLDEELLSGKSFIPGLTAPGNNPGVFRSVFRKVIDVSPLIAGINPPKPHGITFDNRFTLIDLWVAGTNSVALQAQVITGNIVMTATDLIITSPQAFDRAFAFVEYIQEL